MVACLLGLWVRILLEAWMSVSCEHCVLSGRGLQTADHTKRRPTECGVFECDIKTSTMRRPRTTRAVKP